MTANTIFTLYENIGHGARGRVYRAFHKNLNKIVAVKFTPKNVSSDMEVKMIQYVQMCRHSVKYVEHHLIDDQYAIVMEHIDGCDCRYLLELAEHGIYLDEKDIRNIARCMCEFLEDCDKYNIMYGDIKLANIMYIPPSTVKVVDAGCTRPTKNTPFEIPLGTPSYFSPEKFRKCFGPKADIWSVGVVLYQLACGRHPFANRNGYENVRMLYQDISSTELSFDNPQWDRISQDMQDMLKMMLNKDERKRASVRQIMEHPWWDALL